MAKKKVEEPVEEAPDEVVADPSKHVYINLSGGHESYSLVEAPEAFSTLEDGRQIYNRSFRYAGQNVEHVDDDPATGIWRYRAM